MTDLIERLRGYSFNTGGLTGEAADEIERLQAENKFLKDRLWAETWLLTEQLSKAVTINWTDEAEVEKEFTGDNGSLEWSVLMGSLERSPVTYEDIEKTVIDNGR